MKRKVRIYKDPNGQGGYINKTAQWLKKAQEGAETGMTPVTAGIMQQMQPAQQQMMQQQTPQQDQSDMMLQQTTQMISRGMDKEEIKANLLAQYSDFDEGSPEYSEAEAQIDQYIESVYDQLGENAAEETNQDLGQDREEYQNPGDYLEEPQEQAESNYYYDLTEDDESADSDIEEDYSFGNLKYGGIPNKRSFINKTIRQLKKAQEGGDQVEEANTANVRGTEDNPTTDTPGNKNTFVAGIKGQAADHFYKQQAEQMYNNQFGQGMQQLQEDMDFAQRGGFRMRRGNRKLFGVPNLPLNVTSANYRFGPLGGVRSAEVQFNPLVMASMFPMMSFPGMGGYSSWGYNQPYKKTSKGRLVTEKVATAVNNKSIEDVASATNSEAASKASSKPAGPCTEAEVKDPNSPCFDPMYAGLGPVAPGSSSVVEAPTDNVVSNVSTRGTSSSAKLKTDRWGRTSDSKWYGYDPVAKGWTLGVPDWANKQKATVTKSRWSDVTEKTDEWGHPESSKWYLFNPNTKKYEYYKDPEYISNIRKEEVKGTGFDPRIKDSKGKTISIGKTPETKKEIEEVKATKEYKEWLAKQKNKKLPYGYSKKQFGGIISNPQEDSFGNLERFVYGGNEDYSEQMLQDLYQPPINQSDLDDTYSKDVTDAYFRHGGLHRFQGTGDSQTNPTNAGKTYNEEELNKLLAEKQKAWEADYQKKYNQQMQGQQQMMQGYSGGYGGGYNPYDSYSAWSSRGNYGGFGPYASTGLLGAAGNLIKGFGRGPSTFGPAGNPLEYAATAAAITKSGMLPTGMRYSKEKAEGLLGKLGLKHDKTWTLDYATPEQIKAQAAAGVKPGATQAGQQGTSGTSLRDSRLSRRDQRLNRNIPAEADAEAFTGTLTGSTESTVNQPLSNEEMLKAQGKMWDEQQQKWVPRTTPSSTLFPGSSPLTLNTGTAGTISSGSGLSELQPTRVPERMFNQPVANTSSSTSGTAISGMVESPGMVGKTDAEIREGILRGTSIPTVVNKGNTTIINAAGSPIDPNDPIYSDEYAYGGYIPTYMAYGGYIPEADQGINFSSVSYEPNSITQPGGIGQGKVGPCTEEEVKNPNSPCYDPMYAGQGPRSADQSQETAQLKIKEQKGPIDYTKASRGVLDFGANLADAQDYLTERRNKYIPGMTEFAMGEKQTAEERINKGEWNARTGKEGIQGFEGVIRKGGSIKNKKSSATGNKINISDFNELLKLAGLK